MNIWIFLQIILNILLIAAVGYCVLRFKKENQFARSRETHMNQLIAFKDSLEKTIQEGHKVSDRIVEDIESRKQTLSMISRLVENEKNAIMELLEKVKAAGYSSHLIKQKFQEPWINDKYTKTLKLSAEGFIPQEIADRIKLPLGEVELVLSLRK